VLQRLARARAAGHLAHRRGLAAQRPDVGAPAHPPVELGLEGGRVAAERVGARDAGPALHGGVPLGDPQAGVERVDGVRRRGHERGSELAPGRRLAGGRLEGACGGTHEQEEPAGEGDEEEPGGRDAAAAEVGQLAFGRGEHVARPLAGERQEVALGGEHRVDGGAVGRRRRRPAGGGEQRVGAGGDGGGARARALAQGVGVRDRGRAGRRREDAARLDEPPARGRGVGAPARGLGGALAAGEQGAPDELAGEHPVARERADGPVVLPLARDRHLLGGARGDGEGAGHGEDDERAPGEVGRAGHGRAAGRA
jgi:hypothetical protein